MRIRERCRAIIPYKFICNFLLRLTPPLPSSLLATLALFRSPSYPIHPLPLTSCHPPPLPICTSHVRHIGGTHTPPPIATWTATTCRPPPLIGKRSACSVWCCRLPSRTVFFPHFCSVTEQMHGGVLIVVCVFPFTSAIDAAILFLYGIMFFVYAHSLGCHQMHFPAPNSLFFICFSYLVSVG